MNYDLFSINSKDTIKLSASDWREYQNKYLNESDIKIIEQNRSCLSFNFSKARKLPKDDKLNQQPPLTQMYWLGRLAYEFAIRSIEYSDAINNVKNAASFITEDISYEDRLTLALHPLGFTSQPEDNMLQPEHTSYPAKIYVDGKSIVINTIFKFEQLFDILDGAPKSKYQLNSENFKTWQNIGHYYSSRRNYLQLLQLT